MAKSSLTRSQQRHLYQPQTSARVAGEALSPPAAVVWLMIWHPQTWFQMQSLAPSRPYSLAIVWCVSLTIVHH